MRPKLTSSDFKTFSMNQNDLLDSPISFEEIKQAIWDCGGDESLGPDGYTYKVLKNKCKLLKHDIIRFISHFKAQGRFAKGYNSSFITLISKVKDLLNLYDYHINLIG